MGTPSHKLLGQLLKEAGLLTDQQIELALFDQSTSGLRFGEILVRRGWIKQQTLDYFLANAPTLNNAQAMLEGGIPLERCVVDDQVIFRIASTSEDSTTNLELPDLDSLLDTLRSIEADSFETDSFETESFSAEPGPVDHD